MPRSKHRRKVGKKAIRNPGRKKGIGRAIGREFSVFSQFNQRYRENASHHLENEEIAFLIDLIVEEAFVFEADKMALKPISKVQLFEDFTAPIQMPDKEDFSPGFTLDMADTALAILLEQSMVEIADDEIRVPNRFLFDSTRKLL